jgi:hypothetical protein
MEPHLNPSYKFEKEERGDGRLDEEKSSQRKAAMLSVFRIQSH